MAHVIGLIVVIALLCGCPPPEPTPTPTPTATPTPAPTPTPACVPPPDGLDWQPAGDPPSQRLSAVHVSQQALGDVCGIEPDISLDRLGEALRSIGHCAGRMSDAVFVLRDDGLWEEHHAVYYGNGCWLSNTYRGSWRYQ